MQIHSLIVGAGITGTVLARLLAEQGNEVLIIDKRETIGGNCYDYFDENNICIHKYGPHIFRTNDDSVFQFLSRFTTWRKYEHKVRANIDGKFVPIPFNCTAIEMLFPAEKAKNFINKLVSSYGKDKKVPILELKKSSDNDLKELADYIYQKVFYHYTLKQWGFKPEDLDTEALARVPVYTGYYDGYFTEKYQAIPTPSYTAMFENILKHPNIHVQLNTDFKDLREVKYKYLFYTGPIDEFFNYELGYLPYRSLTFKLETLPKTKFQAVSVVNYTGKEPYTRITEFKHFLNTQSNNTTIAYEYPNVFELGTNERFYPIPKPENKKLYMQYLSLADKEKNIYFLGRLGSYKYYSMQGAIVDVFAFVDKLKIRKNE